MTPCSSPDGSELYATGLIGELTTFARDTGTGLLTWVTSSNDGGHDALALSPDGRFLYRSAHPSGAILQHVSVLCPATPLSGCHSTGTGGADLKAKRASRESANKMKWTWRNEASGGDFGTDPLGSTDFALCLYAGGVRRMQALAPAGGGCGNRPCWKQSPSGSKYADGLETPDGLKKLVLARSSAGGGRITASLGTVFLPIPSLPLALPITMQLVNGEGDCWSATYSSPLLNTDTDLRARSD